MILTKLEIAKVMEKAKAAFPNFTDWEYNNEVKVEYFGFSLWGKFLVDPDELMSPSFFITLSTYEEKWECHLTMGQHSYFWSSADFGDAHVLATERYDSYDDAIVALKKAILELFKAFSVV